MTPGLDRHGRWGGRRVAAAIHAGMTLLVLLATPASARPPNVILVLMDDMGWRDVGFMGNDFVETPAIDGLARQGMVFTQAYASAPNCAPTRACLMSGQVPPRHGIYTVVDPRHAPGSPWQKLLAAESESDLATEVVTLPESLAAAGYATAFFGMWNLGRGRRGPTTPGGQGFETVVFPESLGFAKDAYQDDEGRFLSDRLADELLDFVGRNRDRPFFAYFADHAVHAPYDPPADLLAKYERKASARADRRDDPAYAATIECVDRVVARIVAALEAQGLRDDTILIFTSDNGGTPRFTPPLRGAKGELFEGGIRVPLAIAWPGRIGAGSSDVPVATIDLYPTLLDLCGAAPPRDQPLDGTSLAGLLLRGERPAPRRLFWHFPCYVGRATPASAVRDGDWKLVERFEDGGGVELFDLASDPEESRDLAAKEPQRARALRDALHAWQRETGAKLPTDPNPAWDPAADRPRGGGGGDAAKGGRGGGKPENDRDEKGGRGDGGRGKERRRGQPRPSAA